MNRNIILKVKYCRQRDTIDDYLCNTISKILFELKYLLIMGDVNVNLCEHAKMILQD